MNVAEMIDPTYSRRHQQQGQRSSIAEQRPGSQGVCLCEGIGIAGRSQRYTVDYGMTESYYGVGISMIRMFRKQGMCTTFPHCNFVLKFPEILRQN